MKQPTLKEFQASLEDAVSSLEFWRKELYKVTATAKLFQPDFEVARKNCLHYTTLITKLSKQIKSKEHE